MLEDSTPRIGKERSSPPDAAGVPVATCGAAATSTRSSKGDKWVTRWKYVMGVKAVRRGIWPLRGGGYFFRTRIADPRTGRVTDYQRAMRGATIAEVEEARARLQSDVRDLATGRKQAPMLWSTYAASLFEAKVEDGTIKSAKSRERWADTLAHLIPAFGHFYVDEIRNANVIAWRRQVARWINEGMPSIRKRDRGTGKLIPLAPVTANGWIAIFRVICGAMCIEFELDRNPAEAIKMFAVPRKYTREQPNALSPERAHIFLAKMRELFPQHYAMTFLGLVVGARPSTLRPLRRKGPTPDILWDEQRLLLRRSHSMGREVMDTTKTKRDKDLPLPDVVMRVLREHVASLEGPMARSDYLFPSKTGGLRARSVLDKPFAAVIRALKWELDLSPRGLRRTFNDLTRTLEVDKFIIRSISGHMTEEMQDHYSTAQQREMLHGIDRVASRLTPEPNGGIVGGKKELT